jgi:hypothetical protein
MSVEVSPITEADIAAVADFLHVNYTDRIRWARTCLAAPRKTEALNHGCMLRNGQRIVGAPTAFYSERHSSGKHGTVLRPGHVVRAARMLAARHIVLLRGANSCYVMYRETKLRGVPLAVILHVSDPQLFHRAILPLTRHLLVRHRLSATLASYGSSGTDAPYHSRCLRHPKCTAVPAWNYSDRRSIQ